MQTVPIQEMVTAENGQIWRNIVTPEVSKVAETLAEFRGRYKYNLLDENVRRFQRRSAANLAVGRSRSRPITGLTPKISPTTHAIPRKMCPLLISHGSRAFLEYAPMRYAGVEESERVYRHIAYGKLLDVFVIDMRSYRAGNSFNRQPQPGLETVFLGEHKLLG